MIKDIFIITSYFYILMVTQKMVFSIYLTKSTVINQFSKMFQGKTSCKIIPVFGSCSGRIIAKRFELPALNRLAQEVEQNLLDLLNFALGFNFPQNSHFASSTGPPRIFNIFSFFLGIAKILEYKRGEKAVLKIHDKNNVSSYTELV